MVLTEKYTEWITILQNNTYFKEKTCLIYSSKIAISRMIIIVSWRMLRFSLTLLLYHINEQIYTYIYNTPVVIIEFNSE